MNRGSGAYCLSCGKRIVEGQQGLELRIYWELTEMLEVRLICLGGLTHNPPSVDARPTRRRGDDPGGLRNQFVVRKWGWQVKFLKCAFSFFH